ncbi:hypothetical protein PHYBLDRAFT_72291 [Phycomyces blakesleeanus NRRL 1555(-)]|uniref:Uncharacterized protein n=1 Tax=Phycomyces blakesleeanus (strain ATCC 8743b / DSM 1359 / FGSC 10004 / NBRC 33097 / NRRL 1555) TaxID=763407 RepID=A0A162N3M2_PHYB8|nr:hypothetical protein PHYBLDRAFT_72291 [Phycomyces blakesleeanus NRRL 1555(-)]OAD65504.1 hypothetical protein PHYBLDRAFT_72291 [Phycomyces blakesleeanus NRRL 1555(-)]|eukprot:XP_018283544.1 hypothetical protein PHYBLDRAFT_72291 [Phycomyces blakesleeanus NRRL 1555(-)]
MSTCACHKCQRQFMTIKKTSKLDYSGFKYSNWVRRTKTMNLEHAVSWANALNNTERTCLEKENGTRWSELHRLSYFDPVHFTVIDLMHNLYLGTAKRMIQIWRKCNYINEKNQLTMQELANGIVIPCGYARITKKIADGFSFMKADEWKSWCVIYSPFVLKHVLPAKNLENWILFVDTYRLLTKPLINNKEIDEAHSKLQLFCTRFQTLYGKSAVTPNMHLHLHLGDRGFLDDGDRVLHKLIKYETIRQNIQALAFELRQKSIKSYASFLFYIFYSKIHVCDWMKILIRLLINAQTLYSKK